MTTKKKIGKKSKLHKVPKNTTLESLPKDVDVVYPINCISLLSRFI